MSRAESSFHSACPSRTNCRSSKRAKRRSNSTSSSRRALMERRCNDVRRIQNLNACWDRGLYRKRQDC